MALKQFQTIHNYGKFALANTVSSKLITIVESARNQDVN